MNPLGARMGGLVIRTILVCAAVGCAMPAYRYAEVAALRANAPLEVAEIAPPDAKALANALGSRFDSNPGFKPSARDISDIRAALRVQPLEPELLSIMGLTFEVSGDTKKAPFLMRVANRVSRRDSVSGLYLIEKASASGDVKTALRYYNALLSTRPELNGTLLPILSSAIVYPEIRAELRRYLKVGAKWVPAFLAETADKGSLTDLESLLLPLPRTLLSEEYVPILASVLHRVAVEGGRAGALRFASAAIPGFSAATLSNLSVDSTTLDRRLGLFSWTFPPNDGIEVEIGENTSLKIQADPLARGTAGLRDLLLEGGKYQLVQSLEFGSETEKIDARWSADCITTAGPVRFWEQRLPVSDGERAYRSHLIVPQNCAVVRMALLVEGPEGQVPSTLTIGDFQLSRSNRIQ